MIRLSSLVLQGHIAPDACYCSKSRYLQRALSAEFKEYQIQIIKNARVLADEFERLWIQVGLGGNG